MKGNCPLGFFQGEREEEMALAYWTIARITRQVAETDNPLKLEDARLMLAGIKPANHRMMVCAWEGLKAGPASRKVIPTEKSRTVLRQTAQNRHADIAMLATEVLNAWSVPPPTRSSRFRLQYLSEAPANAPARLVGPEANPKPEHRAPGETDVSW